MRKLIIIFLLLTTMGFTSHPKGHAKWAYDAWKLAPKDFNFMGLEIDTRPIAALGSHLLADYTIGEGYRGEYQILIGILGVIVMYAVTPEAEQEDFFWASFWGLLPDIIDKGFGRPFLHRHNLKPIFNLTPDQSELLEEYFMFSYVMQF